MSAPLTLTEGNRSATAYLGKPFRYDVFGVAGKLELGDRANNAALVNGVFREKLLGGLLGTGGTVQSTGYVALQTGLTNVYPQRLTAKGTTPGTSVGPVHQYGANWTLSDPLNPVSVNLAFHMPGSSLLGSLLPGIASPANYNLNPKGYFYVLGEYHAAPPVMSGTLTTSSADQVITGSMVNVSFQITRYDAPIYRPPFLGLDLGDVGLAVLGSPPASPPTGPLTQALAPITTGLSTDLHVTVDIATGHGPGWLSVSITP
ncbi:MAG: hypothetical protein EOP87_02790 [Verrucomicrobiaceae bacterium]|nr:MAG: hypothetical protein EOP87_02790 [Verrucomicrobiaceae bacterium]